MPENRTFFISDLHLRASDPTSATRFTGFLEAIAPQCDGLYILGDLFDYWIGDDNPDPFFATMKQALKKFSDAGNPLYVMYGNHDFCMGEQFERDTGCTLIADGTVVHLYGESTLLSHGDLLCTQDKNHLRLQKVLRHPFTHWIGLKTPLSFRMKIADSIKSASSKATAQKHQSIMEPSLADIKSALEMAGTKQIIHGHTHKPAIHRFEFNGEWGKQIVLSDWHEQGNFLMANPDGSLSLSYFSSATDVFAGTPL